MAKKPTIKSSADLVDALVKLKPDIKDFDPTRLPTTDTVKRMREKSEQANNFFTTGDKELFKNPSARDFRKQMQIFEQALKDSYQEVKAEAKGKQINYKLNFGQTTEAVLLYGMHAANLFRHHAFRPGYFGGDIEFKDPATNEIRGVQVKAPGGVIRINFDVSTGTLKSMVKQHGSTLDEEALRRALDAVIRNSKVQFQVSGNKVENKVKIAEYYTDLSVNTHYMMLRASTLDYFFVTVAMKEFPNFVRKNPHLFTLRKTEKGKTRGGRFPYGMTYDGILKETDLWEIGQQTHFLAIHYPVPSYFYQKRGVVRQGQVSPSVPTSRYSVGEITRYNEHVSAKGKEFEMVHNSFFGNYGKVKAKY